MIKKILFETLQRFDLKDANELQQGVLDKLEGLANGFNWQLSQSIPHGAPLSRVRCVGVANGIARFSPMVLLTAEHDVLVFDSEDQDDARLQVDISATYADWLNTDQTNDMHIYAYPVYEEGDTENREFFSLIDNAPTTRAINTRQRLNIQFFSNLDSSYNLVNAEGYYPIRIGYISAEDLSTTNSSSPFNPTNFKGQGYFDGTINIFDYDDSDLPNIANNRDDLVGGFPTSPTEGLGFYTPWKKIEKQLQRIISYGTADSTDTVLVPNNTRPMYSLQGLKNLIDQNVITLTETLNWGVGIKYTKTGGTSFSVRAFYDTPNLNEHGNQVAVIPRLNYMMMVGKANHPAIPYTNADGDPVAPFSEDEDALIDTMVSAGGVVSAAQIMTNIHLKFPDAYAGWNIDNLTLHYTDRYAINSDLGPVQHYHQSTFETIAGSQPSFIRQVDSNVGDSVGQWDEISTLVMAPAYELNINGSELTDDIGINIRLVPGQTLFTTMTVGESFMVHIMGTIRKRSNS